MKLNEFLAIVEFLGENMTDAQANELMDKAKEDLTAEEICELARPYMIKEHHLDNDDLWEDVFYRAEELGYKLKY